MLHAELTEAIVRAFYRVYDRLGFGFLESVYRNALANEFRRNGIPFEREVPIDGWDQGERVGHVRADFLVDGQGIVEVKASQLLLRRRSEQLLNYLRSTPIEVGLLLHFGEKPKVERRIYTNDASQG